MPIYCWLIEQGDERILVDTGETADIYQEGYLPKGGLYHKAVQTKIKADEEITVQLNRLGFTPKDVSKIIFTHLHGDHIGGLKHFEHCEVFVSRPEYELATSKKGSGAGYFPKNWPSWFNPQLIDYSDPAEGAFAKSKQLSTDGSILIVPTPGHSIGHQSVIVKGDKYTYFIAGDLTYNIKTLKQEIPDVILMNKAAQKTVQKTHQYARENACIYLSSHDWNAPAILEEAMTFDQF